MLYTLLLGIIWVLVICFLIGMYYIAYLVWAGSREVLSTHVYVPRFENDRPVTPKEERLFRNHHSKIDLLNSTEVKDSIYVFRDTVHVNNVPLSNLNAFFMVMIVVFGQFLLSGTMFSVLLILAMIPCLMITYTIKKTVIDNHGEAERYVVSIENFK